MSCQSTSKSGKGNKSEKGHKWDKSDTGKGSNDKGHSAMGSGGGDSTSKSDEAKIKEVIELTRRPENQVCLALHECDYDMEQAILMLLDLPAEDKWETTVKKKRTRQQSAGKTEAKVETTDTAGDDWIESNVTSTTGDKSRNKNNSQKYNRHGGTRVWKGRENQENERNNEDGSAIRDRRGRSGGPARGTNGGARGRGGGRTGGRYPARNKSSSGVSGNFNNNRPMETWDNSWENSTATADTKTTNHVPEENWCDEFPGTDEWMGTLSETKVFTPSQPSEAPEREADSAGGAANANPENTTNATSQQQQQPNIEMLNQIASGPAMSGSLSAAQSQYFNQLTQQSNACDLTKFPPATQHPAYGNSPNYNDPFVQQAPVRTKIQRAKLPPPSKIPASAVEMPGDANSSMLLDLQFGAMDLTDNSFDCSTETKYSPLLENNNATIDLNIKNQCQAPLDSYATKKNIQGNINPLAQTFSNAETIPQSNEHLPSGYNTNTNSAQRAASSNINSNPQIGNTSLEQLSKQSETNPYSQTSNYSSYQSKANNFSNHSYSSSNYTGTQTTASYVSSQSSSNYVSNDASTFTGGQNTTTYAPYSGNASSYQSNSDAINFPSITSQQPYQSNSGINSSFGSNGTSQYNNYNANHKLGKDSASNAYDSSGSSSVANSGTNTSSSTTTPLSIVSSSTSSKNTTTSKSSSGVVSNMPPTGTPLMGQYIMGQVPYFPPMYSYEDMQMLQQRIPHMTTPFYEMSYQTPATTLRDGSFSLSDGRFARTDNNASPVSSSQTNTQPMLAPQSTGPYFFAQYNPIQPSYQFGAVYTSQLPAGTNAHANNNNPQFAKPTTYGTGYNTGYDSLTQSQDYTKSGYISNNQGQSKGTANNSSSSGNSTNELSAIYSKSHSALGKVNSYEKQGFHSGTPPPFAGALGQNALAQGSSGYGPQMFIQTMPQHQHHSSQLIHQPLHQDAGNGSGQRTQGANQQKSGSKQTYPNSYWNQA